MISAYLCLQADEPACRFLNQFADGDIGEDANGPYNRMFSEKIELPSATVRVGWVSLKHSKDAPRIPLKLAFVRPAVDPMEAVLRMDLKEENVLLIAGVSRHKEWTVANNRRVGKEFIVVGGNGVQPVDCFTNALLLNDHQPAVHRRFYENPVRHSVSIYLKGGLHSKKVSPLASPIEPDWSLDGATD